jgi:DNA-binding PadR family transcriptional regulator
MQESLNMHKSLLLLGLLLDGPKTGYDLHRIVRSHGELYSDLKKANVYYLLDHLAQYGYLDVHAESGARGPRGERLIYSLTDHGRARFDELLRAVLSGYEPPASTIGAAIVFLPHVPEVEAVGLLQERRERVLERRAQVTTHNSPEACGTLVGLATDHLLAMIDADLAWTDRVIERLQREASVEAIEHGPEVALYPAGSR